MMQKNNCIIPKCKGKPSFISKALGFFTCDKCYKPVTKDLPEHFIKTMKEEYEKNNK